MIDLTLMSLCNIILRIILISYRSMQLLWIDISFGQIIVHVNSRMLACFIGRMHIERGCIIFGGFLSLAMGKGNMME